MGQPQAASHAQVEAGIRGLSPGAATEAFLLQQQRLTRFWGCLGLAGLALASHLLDNLCAGLLGAPLGAQSLLLLTGFLLSIERQVLFYSASYLGVLLLQLTAAVLASCCAVHRAVCACYTTFSLRGFRFLLDVCCKYGYCCACRCCRCCRSRG